MENKPIYGNYRGYYAKRPFLNDPRLDVLPGGFFKDAVVLDVGCNDGWITCEIAQEKGARRVVGVDIDPERIRAAWKRRRAVWSQRGPDYTQFKYIDKDPDTAVKTFQQANYFPESMAHMFGPLAIPDAKPGKEDLFPHNVSFRTADWVKEDIIDDEKGYDIIIAFSVSKWIHLNQGDEGIQRFFSRIYEVLKVGGKFVLETQTWDSYSKSKRMSSYLKEMGNSLQIRPDDFPSLLHKIGFKERLPLGTVGEGGFSRPIDIYTK